jgi:hypothetical protein
MTSRHRPNPEEIPDMAKATTVKVSTTAQADYRECECGCGVGVTRRFLPGHDQRLKGVLRRAFDAGDQDAGTKLIDMGWNTREQLDERVAKAEAKAEAKAAKQAKVAE